MSGINKIFTGGSIVSGKNILWRLLDGHTAMVSNCMHSNLGFFILNDNCKKFFLRQKAAFIRESDAFFPSCKISYNTGEVASVDIGSFLYGLYSFSNYKVFYSSAKGKSTFVHMKEGMHKRLPLTFDIEGFEKTLEKEMFTGKKIFTEEEVINVIYSSYIENLGNKDNSNNLNKKKYFVDTLPNGIESVMSVANKAPDAKIIIMLRDMESLLYANAVRIMSIRGKVLVDSRAFKTILFNQKSLEKKMRIFYQEIPKLGAPGKNIIFVNFNDLILDTEKIMKKLAKFIGIQYEPILASPSINGEIINIDEHQIIGSINDDPHKCLSEADLDLLKYIIHGFNNQHSVLKNISIFLRAIKWRMLYSLVIELSKVLKFFLPRNYYLKLVKIYKGKF